MKRRIIIYSNQLTYKMDGQFIAESKASIIFSSARALVNCEEKIHKFQYAANKQGEKAKYTFPLGSYKNGATALEDRNQTAIMFCVRHHQLAMHEPESDEGKQYIALVPKSDSSVEEVTEETNNILDLVALFTFKAHQTISEVYPTEVIQPHTITELSKLKLFTAYKFNTPIEEFNAEPGLLCLRIQNAWRLVTTSKTNPSTLCGFYMHIGAYKYKTILKRAAKRPPKRKASELEPQVVEAPVDIVVVG